MLQADQALVNQIRNIPTFATLDQAVAGLAAIEGYDETEKLTALLSFHLEFRRHHSDVAQHLQELRTKVAQDEPELAALRNRFRSNA